MRQRTDVDQMNDAVDRLWLFLCVGYTLAVITSFGISVGLGFFWTGIAAGCLCLLPWLFQAFIVRKKTREVNMRNKHLTQSET